MKGFYRQHKSWPVALALALVTALAFAGVASAASPSLQQVTDTALENFFKREQIAYNDQGLRLQSANTIIGKMPDWINALKAAGKDTSALETALSTYQTQVSAAQASHDSANAALTSHSGFDDSGKVTDRKAALQTIISAGKPMRQAHLTLVQATIDFRTAVQAWRAANK